MLDAISQACPLGLLARGGHVGAGAVHVDRARDPARQKLEMDRPDARPDVEHRGAAQLDAGRKLVDQLPRRPWRPFAPVVAHVVIGRLPVEDALTRRNPLAATTTHLPSPGCRHCDPSGPIVNRQGG